MILSSDLNKFLDGGFPGYGHPIGFNWFSQLIGVVIIELIAVQENS